MRAAPAPSPHHFPPMSNVAPCFSACETTRRAELSSQSHDSFTRGATRRSQSHQLDHPSLECRPRWKLGISSSLSIIAARRPGRTYSLDPETGALLKNSCPSARPLSSPPPPHAEVVGITSISNPLRSSGETFGPPPSRRSIVFDSTSIPVDSSCFQATMGSALSPTAQLKLEAFEPPASVVAPQSTSSSTETTIFALDTIHEVPEITPHVHKAGTRAKERRKVSGSRGFVMPALPPLPPMPVATVGSLPACSAAPASGRRPTTTRVNSMRRSVNVSKSRPKARSLKLPDLVDDVRSDMRHAEQQVLIIILKCSTENGDATAIARLAVTSRRLHERMKECLWETPQLTPEPLLQLRLATSHRSRARLPFGQVARAPRAHSAHSRS
ncbi:unnamed protein product [Cutaneotrichosporon oleaginosum]